MHPKHLARYQAEAVLEELEPRQLYSAGIEGVLNQQPIVELAIHQEVNAPTHQAAPINISETAATDSKRNELVFIDTNVKNYQELLNDILSQNSDDRNIEVILLDKTESGIDQISNTLANRNDVDAIHLIAEGNKAELHLGNSFLNQDSINGTYADSWRKISESLSADADILIYGCNFGQDEAGQKAMQTIANLTGADIAASANRTGHALESADWTLEANLGLIETKLVISESAQQAWQGSLAAITVDTFSDILDGADGKISLREAIIAANNTAGSDTIILGTGTYQLSIAGQWENGGTTGDLDILSDITITGNGIGSTIIHGGGIERVFDVVSGTLYLNRLEITGASSPDSGGGINVNSGATVNIDHVDVHHNTTSGQPGGGVSNQGTFTATDSLIRNNQSGSNVGSGLYNTGTATLTRVSVVNNTGGNSGGGIRQASGTLTLTNVTVSGNSVLHGGAGIEITGGSATISYSTIANNDASNNGDGGGINMTGGSATISNSIVVNNVARWTGNDIYGAVTSGGYNIIESSNGFTVAGTDITGNDAGLGALSLDANSGQYVHALSAGSSAINVASGGVPATDQRGVTRTGSADIGAYELAAAAPIPPSNTVPPAQTTIEDTAKVFSAANGNQISITDADAAGGSNEITLNVTNGTLTLSGVAGLTFVSGDGTADTTMTFRGTANDINTALNGLSYTPTANYSGSATLTLRALDSTLVSLNIDANLQSRYMFDNNVNDVAAGTAQNGALVGNATFTTDGTRGQVLTLDGSGDSVQINSTFGQPQNVTIGGWVNLLSTNGRSEFISINDRLSISQGNTGGVKGSVQVGAGSWIDLRSNQFITGKGWHHVMYVFDGASDVHTLYIDGVQVATATNTDTIYYTGATTTYIGQHPTNTSWNLNGKVDDVRIYNRALSGSEVAYLASGLSLQDVDTVAITVTPVNDVPTFSSGTGNVTTSISSGDDWARAMALQIDGKMVVVGYALNGASEGFAIVRYNVDGSLDSSFGAGGKVTVGVGVSTDEAHAVTIQSDGKILVAGNSHNGSSMDFAVIRLNTDGSLDTDFSGDGKVMVDFAGSTEDVQSVIVQSDGKIIVGGTSNSLFAMIRINTDGILDESFGTLGRVTTDATAASDSGYSLALQTDGKILLAGAGNNNFVLARYNSNGSVDTSFGLSGKVETDLAGGFDVARSVIVQSDGTILVSGYGSSDFALMRFTSGGLLDANFGVNGKVQTDISGSDLALEMVLQPDGKIILGGYNGSFNITLVRYNADGSLDTSFGSNGKVTTTISSGSFIEGLAVRPDGRILAGVTATVGGNRDFGIISYLPDGSIDPLFNTSTITNTLDATSTYIENGSAVILDSNVKIFDSELSLSNFDGATLTLARNGGANPYDALAFDGLTVTVSGANVYVSGTLVGTYAYSGGEMSISFNTNATQSRINTLMQNIVYWNWSDAPPASVQINWTFSDGNTGAQGAGVALIATGSTTVTIFSVNDAPSGTNKTVTTTEDTTYIFSLSDFGFSDTDGNAFAAVWFDTLPGQGTLKWNGVAFSAGNFVNAYDISIGLLTYVPAANASGTAVASFTFRVQDDGGTASGGIDNDPSANTIAINITAVNDAPMATNLSTPETYTEDTALNLTDIVISDADSATVTATLTLSNTSAGSLNTATVGTVTSTYTAGTGVWTASGAIADVNALLAGLTFTPAANFNSSFTISTSINDGTATLTGSKAMTGTAVNDAPVFSGLDNTPTFIENGSAVVLDSNVTVSDVEMSADDSFSGNALILRRNGGENSQDVFSASGTLSSLTQGGNLVVGGITVGNVITNSGGLLVLSFNGNATNARVNSVLQQIAYSNTSDTPQASVQINWVFRDHVSQIVEATGSTTVNITAVNDAPTATNLSSAETYTEDTPLNFTDIVISDVDSATVTATITLSNPAAGSLNTAMSGFVLSAYDGTTGVWTASGAVADVNILLAGLTFTPSANFNGNFTIATSVSDGSTTVTGSKAMTGTAINDAPVAVSDPTAFSSQVLANQPVGYWRLGETSGTIATNLGSLGTDGNYSGPTLGVTGAIAGNTAANFDGVNDSVNLGTFDVNGTGLTMTAWFNADDFDTHDQRLISKALSTGSNQAQDHWWMLSTMQSGSDYVLRLRVQAGGTTDTLIASSGALSANQWNFAAATYDQTTGSMQLYLNGTLVGSKTHSTGGAVNTDPTQTVMIGANPNGYGYFDGRIDEVAVFDKAISQSQLQAIYNSTAGAYSVEEDGTLSVTAAQGVLANDSDMDNNPLTAELVTGPSNATSFTLNADGSFIYTPNTDFNGTDSFTYRAKDGSLNSNVATVTINVTSVNDVPTATIVPTAYAATEQTNLNLHGTGLSISDSDAGNSGVQAIISVVSGTLTATAGTTGVSISGSGSSNIILTGTVTQINNLLAGNLSGTLGYLNNSDVPLASDTLTLQVNDQGNTGSGGALASSDTAVINMTAINDAPVNTIVGAGTIVAEDSVIQLLGSVSVIDADAGSGIFTVTLSVSSAAGTLSAVSGSGVTISGSGSASLVLTGTLLDINNYFASSSNAPVFTATADFNGPVSFTVLTSDNASSVSGGALTDTDTINGSILAVADITDDSAATNEDNSVTFAPLVNDSFENSNRIISHINGALIATGGAAAVTGGSVMLNGDGSLTFTPTANYHGNPSFTYTVTSGGSTETATVNITVNAIADAPSVTNATTNEDTQTSSGLVISRNINDSSEVTYFKITGITGGTLYQTNGTTVIHNGDFISFAQGSAGLKFTPTLNSTSNGSFTVQSSTSNNDSGLGSGTSTATITINPINDAPDVTTNGNYSITTNENTPSTGVAVSTVIVNGPSGSVGYSDVDIGAQKGMAVIDKTGNGNWQFSTDGSNWIPFGAVSNTNALLLDGDTQIRYVPDGLNSETAILQIRGWDQSTGSASSNTNASYGDATLTNFDHAYSYEIARVTATVTAINDTPTDISPNSFSVNENVNTSGGYAVGTLTTTDADSGDTFTLSITGGTDAAKFSISGGNQLMLTDAVLNYETKPSYSVMVRSTDAAGAYYEETLTINVNDVNETPGVSLSNVVSNLPENTDTSAGIKLADIVITDDALGTNNLTLMGADAGAFELVGTELRLKAGTSLNFEAKTSFDVTIQVDDANIGGSPDGFVDFTLAITDVDEFDVTTPIDVNAAANTVAENAMVGTVVGITAFASDADATINAITYSLDDNAGGRFTIDVNTGVVTVADSNLLNYEAATLHNITLRATSADSSFATQSFNIHLTDVNESTISAVSDGNMIVNTVLENASNGTPVGITGLATDPDGSDTVTYSLDDNAGGRFTIEANTGIVSVNSAIDREAAASYNITIRASSSDTSTTTQAFTINIGDVNEFTISSITDSDVSANSVVENATIGTVVNITGLATDSDATTNAITYSLFDDDSGRFAIDANTGVVTVAGAINRETDGASRNITIRATSSDASHSDQTFSIAIADANELNVSAPTDTNTATNAVDENVATGTLVGITAIASDADATTNGVTYTLFDDAGGRFAIDSATGVVTVADGTLLNFETATSHNITVRATSADGSTSHSIFTINVNDVDELDVSTPVDVNSLINSVAENASVGAVVGITAFAQDQDGATNTITYTLDNDAGGLFAIDSSTGVVTVAVDGRFDYEVAASHAITVRATSDDGSFSSAVFTINVTDVNEAPLGSVMISGKPTEGQILSVSNNLVDSDGLGVITYTWKADGNAIGLGTTLILTEAEVGKTITVVASYTDGHGSNESVSSLPTVAVINVNDSPTVANAIIDQSTIEDSTFTFQIPANTFFDVDAGDTLAYSATGLPDWLSFDAATRTFSGTPANADVGVITLRVTATDTSFASVSDEFTLTIANSNDVPVTGPINLSAINEDSGARVITEVDLLANTYDIDGDELTVTGLTITSGRGSLLDNGNGTWTYSPAVDDDTLVNFSFSVSDGQQSIEGNASLDILPVNDLPMAVETNVRTTIDKSYSGSLPTATDVDGDSLSYALREQASHGLVIVNKDGSFSYTPHSKFSGEDRFTYSVSDGNGGVAIKTMTFVIEEAAGGAGTIFVGPNPNETDAETVERIIPGNPFDVGGSNNNINDILIKTEVTDLKSIVLNNTAPKNAEQFLNGWQINQVIDGQREETDERRQKANKNFIVPESGFELWLKQQKSLNLENLIVDSTFNLESDLKATDALRSNIELMKSQMDASKNVTDKADVEIEFVAGTTLSITAGVVTWVLRGGALMSSLLSSVSLFKQFDPLAVVFKAPDKTHEKPTEVDEDEVESMFEDHH